MFQPAGFCSSIQPVTGGQTARDWLNTQAYEFQQRFGLDVLIRFGGGS